MNDKPLSIESDLPICSEADEFCPVLVPAKEEIGS
jgi:hypothetical protein